MLHGKKKSPCVYFQRSRGAAIPQEGNVKSVSVHLGAWALLVHQPCIAPFSAVDLLIHQSDKKDKSFHRF